MSREFMTSRYALPASAVFLFGTGLAAFAQAVRRIIADTKEFRRG